jgi:predicted Holliday junction resolvase-like endonuclease
MIKYDNQLVATREYESKKKSTEVRTGQLIEKWIPFSLEVSINPQNARFIGDPIDFVVFDEDKITFIEVKTGDSSFTKKQRNIKKLVQDGKVEFKELRIK